MPKIELDGNGYGVWVKNWDEVFESQKDEIEALIQRFKKIIEKEQLDNASP